MTKEKIIEIVNSCVQYNANQGTWSIDNRFADALLAEFEQEKKDALNEFMEWLKEWLEQIEDHEKKLYYDVADHKEFFAGGVNMLIRLLRGIDIQLELFFEERKNDKR